MSSHGSIEIVLYVITPDAEQKAAKARNFLDHAKRRWVMQPVNNSAQCALTCYSDNAFWLNDEIEWLADQLETLIEAGFDVSELKCSVGYTSYDVGVNEDSSRIEFDIEGGKLCNWRESRVMMVECEPWNDVKFELHPKTYKLDEM